MREILSQEFKSNNVSYLQFGVDKYFWEKSVLIKIIPLLKINIFSRLEEIWRDGNLLINS